jgi:flagellar hook assembly protein FlgD
VNNVYLNGILPNPSTVRVTATDGTDPSVKTNYSDVQVTPGAQYQIAVPATANAGANFPVTISLIDTLTGLPLPVNNSVTLTAITPLGAPATVPFGTVIVNLVNGVAAFNQSYSHVETVKMRVTDSFNRIQDSANITITPNGLKYVVTLPAAPKSTDEIFPVTVGLYDIIQDALPITDSSYQHTFNVSVQAGGNPGEGSYPVTSATLSDGLSTFNFSYTKAEHIIVQATGTFGGNPVQTGVKDMDITPGAYVKVQLVAPGEVARPGIPSLTGKDSTALLPQAAKENFALVVNAVDRYWNVVTSVNTPLTPTVRLTASDGSFAAVSPQSFSNGTALFAGLKLNTPPQVIVTADDTSNTSLFPQSVTISLTGRKYDVVTSPLFPPNYYSGPPRTFQADVTLYRFDGASTGAVVNGYTGNVTITPLSPSFDVLPTSHVVIKTPSPPDPNQPNVFPMDPSGLITLELGYKVAEDVILRFTDEDGWQGFTSVIHFVPRDVTYEVTLPDASQVGPPTTFPMTVSPRDIDTGTIVKNAVSTVTLTAISQATGLPGTGTLQVTSVNLNGGASAFQQAYSQSGLFKFRVTDGVRIFDSAPMNFLPGPLAALTTDLPATIEAGSTRTVRTTLLDAFSNPIPNGTVHFALSDASFGTLSSQQGVSDVSGLAAVDYQVAAQASGLGDFILTAGDVSLRQSFRVLGPPQTSLAVAGRGITLAKGYSLKPGDPVSLSADVQPGMALQGIYYSVDGAPFQAYVAPLIFVDVGLHVIRHYGVASSLGVHTESVKTSKTVFVTAMTNPEEGLVNYPNPFRAGQDVSFLEYHLVGDSGVSLKIYNLMGQLIFEREYLQGQEGGQSGLNRITWDGRNGSGEVVGNGGYIAVLELKNEGRTMKRKIAVSK